MRRHAMSEQDPDRERGPRAVRPGDTYDSGELEAVERETVPPAPEVPDDEQAEPWAADAAEGSALERLKAYRAEHPEEEATDGDD